jgi:D-alanyl-D-alanine carboxypeptidase/D-alanyl-D-alanine-endopeptidase (penicillin-binding protein 4)
MSGKMSVEGLLDALVGSVKKAGATHISEIIMDDRVFDREFVHPTWPVDQLDRWYCAPIAGVNFHTNVLSVFPSPSSAGIGRPPTILLEPAAPWLELENRARTAESGRNSIRVSRDPAANRFTVQGEIGIARVRAEITVCDPSLFAGQLVAAALPGAGVGIGATPALPDASGRKSPTREQQLEAIRTVRLADPKEALEGRVIAVVTTHIEDILNRCNTDSYNLYGEAMLKRIGHEITGEPGSFANGSSVIRMTLSQQLGPEAASTTVITDGSGMSRENRVSPRTMTRWLDSLQKNPRVGPMFIASLATPDSRDSMRRRFRDARLTTSLNAKTGTIDGVRCLSGYLTDPATDRRLAFSIMVNGLKEGVQTPQALQFHESVVAAADEWLVAQRPPKTRTRPAGVSAAAPGSPTGLPDPVGAGRP